MNYERTGRKPGATLLDAFGAAAEQILVIADALDLVALERNYVGVDGVDDVGREGDSLSLIAYDACPTEKRGPHGRDVRERRADSAERQP